MEFSKALVKRVLFDSVDGTNDANVSGKSEQAVLDNIKAQYRDIYRIITRAKGLILNEYDTELELFPEFDQMSGELLSFKGWCGIRKNAENGYDDWQMAEVELKPMCSQNGLIHSVRGTLQWLSSNSVSWLKGKTRPLSARVKYELPSGRICAFLPSFIGDSRLLESAKVEFRSSAFNLEFTV